MKRLGLLHSVTFLVDVFKKEFAVRFPELQSFHMVDESIVQALTREGSLTTSIVRRVCQYAVMAEQAGAEVLLFTCSATSPAVNVARQLVSIPIIKIDDPMMKKAVSLGRKLGFIATTKPSGQAAEALIAEHALAQNKNVEIIARVEDEAFQILLSGDRARHDEIIKKAALELASQCDVLILAQASLAPLQQELAAELKVPVLASLELCLDNLREIL